MSKNTEQTPVEHTGGPASALVGVQESSEAVRQAEMGVTGTRETTLAGLDGAAPVVDHAKAAKDQAQRQASDDARRRKARDAEAKYAKAVEDVHKASSPQFGSDGKPLYNDLGQPLDGDGNIVEERPGEAKDKAKRL